MIFTLFLSLTAAFWIDPETDRCYLRPPNPICPGSLVNGPGRVLRYPENDRMTSWEYARQLCNKFVAQIDGQLDTVATCDWSTGDRWFDNKYEFTVTVENGTEPDLVCPFEVEVIRRRCNRRLTLNAALEIEEPDRCPEPTKREDHIMRLVAEAEERADALRAEAEAKRLHAEAVLMGKRAAAENRAKAAARAVLEDEMLAQAGPYPEFGSYNDKAAWMQKRQAILPCRERYNYYSCRPSSNTDCVTGVGPCECRWDAEVFFLGSDICPGANEDEPKGPECSEAEVQPGQDPFCMDLPCNERMSIFQCRQYECETSPEGCECQWDADYEFLGVQQCPGVNEWDLDRCYYQVADHPPFCGPEPTATTAPTAAPTAFPTPQPTSNPTPLPTAAPTAATASPTKQPTSSPTPQPTGNPTVQPTSNPTDQPTSSPTPQPTDSPTHQPTLNPTAQPTDSPTNQPTSNPTPQPTDSPTNQPTANPTAQPTDSPTPQPTANPTAQPTDSPTNQPTTSPTPQPTSNPTRQPTASPSQIPTASPTPQPTAEPTSNPTPQPTDSPTLQPTANPTAQPTDSPTPQPTANPTVEPTASPTVQPTANPTAQPTDSPTNQPTSSPTDQPTSSPTTQPTAQPTAQPTTANPTANPTPNPTASPTTQPTAQPTLATKSPTPNPTFPTVAPPIYDGPTIDDVAEVIVRTLRYASYEQRLLCPVSYIRIKGDCSPEIEDVSEVCPLLAASFYEQGLNVLQCRCKIRGASRWFKWARGKIDCVVATEYIEADQAAALRAPNVNIDSAEIVGEDEALSFFGLSNNDSSDNQIVAIVIGVVALLALCACCAAAVLFGTARRRSTGKGVSAAPMSVMHTPRESMKSSFATEAVDLEYDGTRSRKSPRRSTLALSQRAASPGAESPRRSSRRQHSRRVSREQRGNNAFSTVHDLRSFSGGDAAAADAHPMGPRSMSETHFSPDDIARARAAHAGESPF